MFFLTFPKLYQNGAVFPTARDPVPFPTNWKKHPATPTWAPVRPQTSFTSLLSEGPHAVRVYRESNLEFSGYGGGLYSIKSWDRKFVKKVFVSCIKSSWQLVDVASYEECWYLSRCVS